MHVDEEIVITLVIKGPEELVVLQYRTTIT